jgi:hypothetical protein
MSAVANIVLNDAQATPVAHTFIPLGPDSKGVWWWEDQSGSNAIGYNRISLQLTRSALATPGSNSGERVNRVKIGIHTPVLETLGTADNGITPPPTLAFTPRFTAEFILSERASLQNRKDLRKYADFLLADTQVIGMVESLQNVF